MKDNSCLEKIMAWIVLGSIPAAIVGVVYLFISHFEMKGRFITFAIAALLKWLSGDKEE